ncbi:hypothetical protein [Nocardioides coralli]|uniref:hypothetical protein n=1 Tax=Nocardioides coralli TaxID=2872154 RepID=UPI001CA39D21|nr:hypothetical protein [Nocardioides coralli]QZY30203.1 hypothetical protein K6T13_05880 [Nocardioides coralli]
MTDLHCPARIFLLRPGPGSEAVLERLVAVERVTATYHRVASSDGADLADLADRHRGEAVVVVGEHPHRPDLALVEVDADGERVVPLTVPDQ